MTEAQSERAVKLLREMLNWVPAHQDDDKEVARQVEALRDRAEGLLVEVGAVPGIDSQIAQAYRLVLWTRERERIADAEVVRAVEFRRQAQGRAADVGLKRHRLAVSWLEQAERARQAAEGAYHRLLERGVKNGDP